MKLDLDQLRDLIRLLDESNLTEIEVEHDDDRIRVRRDPSPLVSPAAAESAPAVAAAEEAVIDSDGNRVFVMEAEIGGVTLSLGYIVARSSNPFAEINGTEVWIDSEIEGFVVEAIEADRVILRDDKGLLILRVP